MTTADDFYVQLDHGGPPTVADYFDVMNDRPLKFTPEQVGYSPKPKYAQVCDDCVHFFRGKVARRNTCEIMRPHSETESVAPCGWCRFWTNDYRTFPLIDKETTNG